VNILYFQKGGSNPASRLGTLAAMTEYHSFETSPFKKWTADWSIREGHYYSNKAPGPMLLGWPFYKVWEIFRIQTDSVEARNERRLQLQDEISFILSILLQCIPLIFLLNHFFKREFTRKKTLLAQSVFLILAICFGSTGAFFFNTYFGHAFAVISVLGFLMYWRERQFLVSGFFLALGVLSDYGSILMIPAALVAQIFSKKNQPWKSFIFPFLKGTLIPLLLWCVYHTICFGNPWTLANKYQNPVFQDLLNQGPQLWGIFSYPSWETTRNLLWGSTRGILQTQSWVLLTIPALLYLLFIKKKNSFEVIFSLCFFIGLFYMNISFGGWHGGASPGARYLSAGIASLALALWVEWENLSPHFIKILWGSISVSLIFYAHVMSTSILMSGYPILEEAFNWVWKLSVFPYAKAKTILLIVIFLMFVRNPKVVNELKTVRHKKNSI
jgi:uncharacterized membrane protein YsdA (DUF1294 family)